MSDPYEEFVEGEAVLRLPPPPRHERSLEILCKALDAVIGETKTSRMLAPRSIVQLSAGTMLRPDLCLVTRATGKPWLIVEVIHGDDHRMDTVLKKELYETMRIPRLWIVDTRYDNAEVYHAESFGLALKSMLAGRDTLQDSLLPGFGLTMKELFEG